MSITYAGAAVVFGAGNISSASGLIISSTTVRVQSNDFTRDGESVELLDEVSDCIGIATFNKKKSLTIVGVPWHATVKQSSAGVAASAAANMNAACPAPGVIAVITDADGSIIDGDFGAKYSVISSRVRRTNNGPAMIEVDLEQFDAYDVVTAPT